MTTTYAIEETLTPRVVQTLRKTHSSPELLKLAALHCFAYPASQNGLLIHEEKIQIALRHLQETGEYIE